MNVQGLVSHPGVNLSSSAIAPQMPVALAAALATLKSGDFHARWDAVKVISRFGEVAIAPLLNLLETQPNADENEDEDDWELPWFIARALGNLENPQVIPILVTLLKSGTHADVVGMAATALVSFGTEAIAAFSELLSYPNLRQVAVQSLAQIHHPDVVPTLLTIVHDHDVKVRSEVIIALSYFDAPEVPPILVNALTDPVAKIRQAAIAGLGYHPALVNQLNLIDRIQSLLSDVNPEVCQQAALTLSRMGTDAAIVALREVLLAAATPTFLKIEVVRSLAWMEKALAIEALQGFLEQTYASEPDLPSLEFKDEAEELATLKVCQEIVAVLGRIEAATVKPKATAGLIHLLQTNHPITQTLSGKQAIAQSLGQLGQPEAIEALIQLLADGDASVQFHAIAALKQGNSDMAHQRLQDLMHTEISLALQTGIAIALQEWQA